MRSMSPLRYTLLTDGPSDACLVHVLNWLLLQFPGAVRRGFIAQYADAKHLPAVSEGLAVRMRAAANVWPCDVLFVHRDAERVPLEERFREIRAAAPPECPPPLAVVPVRMTEAWLLIDEAAIRKAADNPHGTVDLALPKLNALERIADPKAVLRDALVLASEKSGRHRDRFSQRLASRVQRVAELIGDFSPLRSLRAFRAVEEQVRHLAANQNW